MNITIKGSVDAGKLNDELAAALGDWCVGWTPTHNANEAIVTLSPERGGDEKLVRDTIDAHIAKGVEREAAKPLEEAMRKIESEQTPRMLREAALGVNTAIMALQHIQDAIVAKRVERTAALRGARS